MNNWWKNLNLTQQERRFIVIVGVVFFLVLNWLLVWPRFKEWSTVRADLDAAKKKLAEHQSVIAGMPKLNLRLSLLETNSPAMIAQADQATHFVRTLQAQAIQSRVNVEFWSTPTITRNSTNKFFEEHSLTLRFNNTGESNLVNFLYSLGEGNSSVRVRDLTLKPDSSKTALQGQLVLVASYQTDKSGGRRADAKASNSTSKTP